MAEALQSVVMPIIASIGGIYAMSHMISDNRVAADSVTTTAAKNGSTKMNSSLDGLSGQDVPPSLVAMRMRPDDISHSVSSYDGLEGRQLVNTSHTNIATNARLNKSGLQRVDIGEVHTGGGAGGAVLPPVVDPSTSFLQAEIFVNHPYPTRDIRGDPPIPMSGPMEAPLPAQGPWQPELGTIRQGTSFPLPVQNAAVDDFFA